ncbi:mitotic fidelity of chromosome transmission- protein, partial [Coemansia sp. RSA 2336]
DDTRMESTVKAGYTGDHIEDPIEEDAEDHIEEPTEGDNEESEGGDEHVDDTEEHEDAEVRIEEPTEEEEPVEDAEEHTVEPAEEPIEGNEAHVEDTEEHIEEPIEEPAEMRFDESSELSEPELTSKRPRKPQSQEGVRRSTRTSVPPLAFWRNEHIEYEYDNRVPKVKNVVRVRHTAEEKRQRRRKRKQLPGLTNLTEVKKVGFYYYDDENYGFAKSGPRPTNQTDPDDDDIAMTTEPIPVLVGGTEQAEEVVLSRHDIEWTQPNNKYQVGIGLVSEGSGSGVLSLAVKGSKPPRSSGTKSIFYLVTCGQVEFHIHSSQFSVGILGQVVVPPNNTYAIKNIGTHPAQLYFVQVEV